LLQAVGEDAVMTHAMPPGDCLSSLVSGRERPMTQSLYSV
jgi:hypothetical protein